MDVNNSYKRFQTYSTNAQTNMSNTFKQDFMEQNYKVEKKSLGEKRELGEKKDLSKPDNLFLERSTRLGVNSQGQFIKK